MQNISPKGISQLRNRNVTEEFRKNQDCKRVERLVRVSPHCSAHTNRAPSVNSIRQRAESSMGNTRLDSARLQSWKKYSYYHKLFLINSFSSFIMKSEVDMIK